MLKKGLISFIVIILIIGMLGNVYAADLKTKLDIIQQASETKYLENDQGYISKTIVDSNSNTGEVKIQLKLNNVNNKNEEGNKKFENTEIFIIIPEYTNAKENEKLTYIETLSSKILKNNSNTKIGVVGIKGPIADVSFDQNGNMIHNENDQATVKGTANDAELIVNLTNNLDTIKNNLRNMNSQKKEYYVNVQAAIRLAKNSFSKASNKIIISLYDNVPSTTIGTADRFSYIKGKEEQACREQLSSIVNNTKQEILSLKSNNIEFILLRPDDSKFDRKYYDSETGKFVIEIDGKPYADDLYGTLSKPTYGKMYSLNNDSLEKIVTEYIYSDVMQLIQQDIKDVVIKDYFPKEIVDNFDITISENNVSKVDTKELETNRFITWNIGKLAGNKAETLEYALKIKDMNNKDILNKVLPTNEKVVLTYKDNNSKDYTLTLESSPKVQLSQIKEDNGVKEPNNNNNVKPNGTDNTIANGGLPQTGVGITIGCSIIAIIIVSVLCYKQYCSYKDIK